MPQWEFSPAGKAVIFSAVEANGKTFLRAGGRVVARPLAPGEQEREFEFDGGRFRLMRTDGGLALEMLPRPAELPVDAAAELTEQPEPRSWQGFSETEPPPVSVVFRARIFFAVALLFFIYCGFNALRFHHAQAAFQKEEQLQRIFDRATANDRSAGRVERSASMLESAFVFECLLAVAGMALAGFLMRGFRWAPAATEAVIWLAFATLVFTGMRLDRVMHVQMNAAFDPVRAAAVLTRSHYGNIGASITFSLIAGGLLHLVGRRTVDRLYDEESY